MAITKLNSLAIPPDTVVESDISFPLDSASFTGDLTVDTDTLVVDSTNNVINTAGNIVITKSNPAVQLTTTGSNAYIDQNTTDATLNVRCRSTAGTLNTLMQMYNDNVILQPNGNGFVGIDEDDPQAKLHVTNTIRVDGSAPTIQLAESDTADNNYQIRVSGGKLRLQANNDAFDSASTKITMSSTGYLGINEANPDVHLHLTNTTAPVLRFERNDTAVAKGNGIGQIQFAHREAGNEGVAATLRVEAKDGVGRGAFVFQTGLAGTVTENIRVDSDGIKFGGETTAAHALDDYEEGTWNPVFTGSTTNPTVTYDRNNGFYVKIGRKVYARLEMRTDSVSGGSGSLLVSGLPYNASTGSGSRAGGITVHYASGWGGDAPVRGYVNDNSNGVILLTFDQATAQGAESDHAISVLDLNTGSNANYFMAEIVYEAN